MITNEEQILSVLDVIDKEDIITNILAYCVKVDVEFARMFIDSVCGINAAHQYSEFIVETRITTTYNGVPDLLIAAKDGEVFDLFLIENKVMAEEGIDQTANYANQSCIDEIKRKMMPGTTYRDVFLTFLTLFPDQKPKCEQFNQATYQQLLDGLKTITFGRDALADLLIRALQYEFNRFYVNVNRTVNDNDWLIENLALDNDLDGAFLYFKRIFEGLQYPSGFVAKRFSRDSWHGRKVYLVMITKPEWHPDMMEETPDRTIMTSDRCYNLHFEVQYNVLKRQMAIYLHYETNPYLTEKDAQHYISESDFKLYQARRGRFIEYMRESPLQGFVVSEGYNQIGRFVLPVSDTTSISDFRSQVCSTMNTLTNIVDGFSG